MNLQAYVDKVIGILLENLVKENVYKEKYLTIEFDKMVKPILKKELDKIGHTYYFSIFCDHLNSIEVHPDEDNLSYDFISVRVKYPNYTRCIIL